MKPLIAIIFSSTLVHANDLKTHWTNHFCKNIIEYDFKSFTTIELVQRYLTEYERASFLNKPSKLLRTLGDQLRLRSDLNQNQWNLMEITRRLESI